MDINQRVKQAIEYSGLSYRQIENITGISRSTLQRYATGNTSKIPIGAIRKIAIACGVSGLWLMGDDDQMIKEEPSEDSPQAKIIQLLSERPPERRQQLLALIKIFLSSKE